METFDLIVIGSGPGGYVAAIRAAELGLHVACIEKDPTLGGTCLNVGCIPSKTLLASSELVEKVQLKGATLGFESREARINWTQMQKRKREVVSKLTNGVDFLFRQHKVKHFQGEGRFKTENVIEIFSAQSTQEIRGKYILLATGSEPISLPFLPFDEKKILSSTGALSLPTIPRSLLLIGAGVIGLELGSVYRRLGSQVTVIELLDRPCPQLDREISRSIASTFKAQGIDFHFSSQVTKGEIKNDEVYLSIKKETGEEQKKADVVLIGIGRKPYTKNLGLEKVGIQTTPKGFIPVDGQFRTAVSHVFAIGDVVEGPQLAHKASDEGVAVVEYLAGLKPTIDYIAIPIVMYTYPEVAGVGLTEEEAKAMGLSIKKANAPFRVNARALCSDETEGFVKVIADRETNRLLGLHIIGPHASEMIGIGALALKQKLTVQELYHLSFAHPTCSEAIKEAAGMII